MIAIRQKVLASQPFSVLIGATLVRLEAGAAEIDIPVKEELNCGVARARSQRSNHN